MSIHRNAIGTAALMVLLFTPARALDTVDVANSLGSVIASEEACGLQYDQDAIKRFIDAKVPADDMGFPNMLNMMTQGASYSIRSMSASAKAAHCRQIERVAKSYGFAK